MATETSHERVAYIDGLRAIAVLAVVVYHFDPRLLPTGFTGVDVFFVISGFVVTAALASRRSIAEMSFGKLCVDFYSRRFTRILPALFVCLITTAVFSALFIPKAWLSDINEKTARYAIIGLSNQALARSGGYFEPRAEYNPFTHSWSLGIEEQFYFCFPFLFYLIANFKNQPHKRSLGFSLLAVLTTASLVYSATAIFVEGKSLYYSFLARFWEISAGVSLFYVTQTKLAKLQDRRTAMLVVQVLSVALLALGFVYSDPNAFPFPVGLTSCARNTRALVFFESGFTTQDSVEPAARDLHRKNLLLALLVALAGFCFVPLDHWNFSQNLRPSAASDFLRSRDRFLLLD